MHRNLNTRSQQKESDSRSHLRRSHQRSHSRCSHCRSHSRRSHQRSHSRCSYRHSHSHHSHQRSHSHCSHRHSHSRRSHRHFQPRSRSRSQSRSCSHSQSRSHSRSQSRSHSRSQSRSHRSHPRSHRQHISPSHSSSPIRSRRHHQSHKSQSRSRSSYHHRSYYEVSDSNDQFTTLSSKDSSPQNRGRSLTKRTLTNQSSILQNQPSSSITPALNSGGVESQEIQELRNVILNLTQRLNNLTEKNISHEEPLVNRPNRSLSPILIREQKRELPLISSNYKKTLHATNTSDIHSDEWSTEDEELANKKRSKNTRSGRLINNNSVIKIYDKKWRSSEIQKILHRSEEIGISIGSGLSRPRYRSDENFDKKSKPKENISSWWISSSWVIQESDEDGDEEDNSNDDNNDDNNDEDKNNASNDKNDNNVNDDNNDKNNDNKKTDNNDYILIDDSDEKDDLFRLVVPKEIIRGSTTKK
ncbi:1245_t:CDS:2, partial [Rhizophagus irregularis]